MCRAVSTAILTLVLALSLGCSRTPPAESLAKAVDAMKLGKFHTALELTEQCLDADRDNVDAMVLRGIGLHQLQRRNEALEVLDTACRTDETHFAAHYFHGWVLAEGDKPDYEAALTPLRRAQELDPGHIDVLLLLARCCLEQNLPEGVRYLQALRRHDAFRRDPALHNGLAYLWLIDDKLEQARKSMVTAHECAPDNPVPLQNLAVLHDQYLNDRSEALRYYRYAVGACQRKNDATRQAPLVQRMRQLASGRRTQPAPNPDTP